MKCPKCGAELTDDTKFCSYCGEKIEADASRPEEVYNEPAYAEPMQSYEEPKKDSTMDKVKGKAISFWKKLSLLGKLSAISLSAFALLGLIAFLAGRVFAGIIAVVAVAVVVVALLMMKKVIKVPKTWIPLMAVILSFVLVVPYFSLFKINISEFARYNYHLLECGDGMSMFENAKILQNDGMLDLELLEKYITENLGGVIGESYAEVKTNITFTEGEIIDNPEDNPEDNPQGDDNKQDTEINSPQTGDNSHIVLWVLLLSISATCIVVLEIYRRKKTAE